MRLGLPDDELAACVGCGLCLPHCPTYRVTGLEARSPRGRIRLMRSVDWDGAGLDDTFVEAMDTCLQCRGCETACPSAVPFGHLMEGTREALADQVGYQPWWRRMGYRALGSRAALRAGSIALAAGQRVGVVPRRLGLPRLPLRPPRLEPSGEDVWLFTGCVMDAWQRSVHLAAQRVVEAAGAGVALPGAGSACCGALAQHAGLSVQARALSERVLESMPGDQPILVDSAGCGAMLKDYGRLLGTKEALELSARVLDIHEWLAERVDRLGPGRRLPYSVAVQDPCHLRHVQRSHRAVRTVLGPFATLVELDDEGLCCGAGGVFSALHPGLATAIRDRKVAAIDRSGAPVVASANPGCAFHLAAAGVDVRHPVELVAEALGLDPAQRVVGPRSAATQRSRSAPTSQAASS